MQTIKDFSDLERKPYKKAKPGNLETYYSAAVYVEDIKTAKEHGANTLLVFLLINHQNLYGDRHSYGHPERGLINVNKYMRDLYGVTYSQWKRGVDNLEAAGLIEVKKEKGRRTRVKLLTKQPPRKSKNDFTRS
jgi:hypothetical protein